MSSNKQIKLLYFILNIVFLVPFILSFFSLFGIIAAWAIIGIGFFYFVGKSNEVKEAYTDLVKMLFMDSLIFGSLIFLYFLNTTTEVEYSVGELLDNINPMLVIFMLTYVVAAVLKFRKKLTALCYIIALASIVAIGYLICVALCTTDGRFVMPQFVKGGAVVLNTYLIFSAIFVLCSVIVNLGKVKNFNLLLLSLSFVIFLWVFISCYGGILSKAYEFEQDFGKFFKEAALWAKVIIVYVISIFACFAKFAKEMNESKDSRVGFNINVLLLLANTALLYKFALSWYNRFNYLLICLYVLTILFFLWIYYEEVNGREKKATDMDYDNDLVMTGIIMVETIIFVLSIWMFKHNMWINALVILVFTIILVVSGGSFNGKGYLYSFLFVFLQTLASIFQFRLSLDNVIVSVIILIAAIAAFLVLNLRNPNSFKTPRVLNMTIFVLFCILNVVLVSRHGTKINVYPDEKKVGVVVKARGNDNEVYKAVIYWTDSRGEKITEETEFTDQIESDIHGACMHIITTDSFGVVSKKTEWFPYWRYIVYGEDEG